MKIEKYGNKVYYCERCGTEVKITSPFDIQYGFIGFGESFLGVKQIIRGEYLICPQCYAKIVLEQ